MWEGIANATGIAGKIGQAAGDAFGSNLALGAVVTFFFMALLISIGAGADVSVIIMLGALTILTIAGFFMPNLLILVYLGVAVILALVFLRLVRR